MSDMQPSRQVLENLWRKRVEDAKIRLDFASKYVKEVQRDLKAGTIPSPDGHYAYQHGLRVETLAVRHYRHVLNTLNELVLRGKIPDEPSKAIGASEGGSDEGSE